MMAGAPQILGWFSSAALAAGLLELAGGAMIAVRH
jgi:hypothetical protein